MHLGAGTRVGPYIIGAAIGAGGVGEVYRATDSNLKRSVATALVIEHLGTERVRARVPSFGQQIA